MNNFKNAITITREYSKHQYDHLYDIVLYRATFKLQLMQQFDKLIHDDMNIDIENISFKPIIQTFFREMYSDILQKLYYLRSECVKYPILYGSATEIIESIYDRCDQGNITFKDLTFHPKTIKITENEYKSLKTKERAYDCLVDYGVDNWSGYSDAMKKFRGLEDE